MREAVYIPARFGSSRFPGKCLAEVAGRPVLAWSIENARKGCPNRRVIVLSEHDETLRLARSLGCETVKEPESMGTANIFEPEMVGYCNSVIDSPPEVCIVVYGNTVCSPSGIIDLCARAIREGHDYAQSVCRVPNAFHPWRVVRDDLSEFVPGKASAWSQDFPPLYVVSAAAMAFHRSVPDRVGSRPMLSSGLRCCAIIHDSLPLGDIDDAEDLEAARRLLCAA